jgi:hypothetical protein
MQNGSLHGVLGVWAKKLTMVYGIEIGFERGPRENLEKFRGIQFLKGTPQYSLKLPKPNF